MRRKHNVYYYIDSLDHYWYQGGRWIQFQYLNHEKAFSSSTIKHTYEKAFKSALSCPGRMVVSKVFYKHGLRFVRTIEIGALDKKKKKL